MTRLASLFVQSLFAILIGGGILPSNLQAQNDGITVSVPFAFTVGSQSIAPGTYQFSLNSGHVGSIGFLLSITNLKTGAMQVFDVLPERQFAIEERGRLTFRTSAGRPMLATVHFPGSDTFSEVVQRHDGGQREATPSSISQSGSVSRRCACTADPGQPAKAASTAPLSSLICAK
jgi:hypothetical protein